MELSAFSAINRFQPFNVAVSSNVLLLMVNTAWISKQKHTGKTKTPNVQNIDECRLIVYFRHVDTFPSFLLLSFHSHVRKGTPHLFIARLINRLCKWIKKRSMFLNGQTTGLAPVILITRVFVRYYGFSFSIYYSYITNHSSRPSCSLYKCTTSSVTQ